MKSNVLQTAYGTLRGVARAEYTPGGSLAECFLTEKNHIITPLGTLIPQYEEDGVRRKFSNSLSFYPSGRLRSISLQASTAVATSLGTIPAELLTFYESGSIKRVFPLNGKLSGFWSEQNEYALAPLLDLKLPLGEAHVKPISLYFYETGALKSVTLWPMEHLSVPICGHETEIRVGCSFYPSGAVRCVEPMRPTPIDTPIGRLVAFDEDALGICGDHNSLCLDEKGRIQSLKTSKHTIQVIQSGNLLREFEPRLEISHFSDALLRAVPMQISFLETNQVVFDHSACFPIAECRFIISDFDTRGRQVSNDCQGCGHPDFFT